MLHLLSFYLYLIIPKSRPLYLPPLFSPLLSGFHFQVVSFNSHLLSTQTLIILFYFNFSLSHLRSFYSWILFCQSIYSLHTVQPLISLPLFKLISRLKYIDALQQFSCWSFSSCILSDEVNHIKDYPETASVCSVPWILACLFLCTLDPWWR